MSRPLSRARVDLQLDFGGQPGGVFDNHGVLVAAIAAKSKYGHDGLEIYIPAGQWLFRGDGSTAVTLRSGVRIIGAGINRTVLLAAPETTFNRLLFGSGSLRDIAVEGLTLDLSLQSGGLGTGIEMQGGENLRFNIGVRNTQPGGYALFFTTNPTRNVWIWRCLMDAIGAVAIRFGAGTAVEGAFIQHNRISCDAADYLEVVSPTSDPDETANYVTEFGVSRWTGGSAGAGEGPFTTPTLGAKWQNVPTWEVVQYYKQGNAVTVQGAAEVIAGQAVAFDETIFTLDVGFRPAKPTPRVAGGGIALLIGTDGTVKYRGETPFASWLFFDLDFRLGGA